MSRPLLAALLVGDILVLSGLVAAVAYDIHETGTYSIATASLAGATAVMLLVLLALYAVEPSRSEKAARHCFQCGTAVFLTVRSLDRRAVYTCFGCGFESLVPRGPAPVGPPGAPSWPV